MILPCYFLVIKFDVICRINDYGATVSISTTMVASFCTETRVFLDLKLLEKLGTLTKLRCTV